MGENTQAIIYDTETAEILECAGILKMCGLYEKPADKNLGDFIIEKAEQLYDLTYTLMWRTEGCEEKRCEENGCKCSEQPVQELIVNKTSEDIISVWLSEEDSKIVGEKFLGLALNKYPAAKPMLEGCYLVRLANQVRPEFLYYSPERDEWLHPHEDWLPVNKEYVLGWLDVF